jgi:hypothetical protein
LTIAKIQPQKREVKFLGKNFQTFRHFVPNTSLLAFKRGNACPKETFPDDGRWQMAVVLKREWQPI